jgi:ParB-like chromosome segregation protein Spo0J
MSQTPSTQKLRKHANLELLEEARACATLKELGLTQEQVAARVGRSRSSVANLMRLLNLSEEILGLIGRGELSETHGIALLRAKDPEVRGPLARAAVREGWSAQALQARVDQSNEAAPAPPPARKQQRPARKQQRPARNLTRIPPQVMHQAATVAWTARLGGITAEALAERDQLSITSASKQLDQAVDAGLMDKHSLLVGYSALYTVTRAGHNLACKHADAGEYASPKGLRMARVNIKDSRHTIACAGVAAALERRYPDYRLIGERELRRNEGEQSRRLATVEVRGSRRKRSHAPDIVIWPPRMPGESPPSPVAVEVELSRKSKTDLIENCRAWAGCLYVEAVLYFAETRRVEERLLEVIEELKAEEMIIVNPLSEILKPLPGFPLTDK